MVIGRTKLNISSFTACCANQLKATWSTCWVEISLSSRLILLVAKWYRSLTRMNTMYSCTNSILNQLSQDQDRKEAFPFVEIQRKDFALSEDFETLRCVKINLVCRLVQAFVFLVGLLILIQLEDVSSLAPLFLLAFSLV